jgi:hypothetical protein
VKCPKCKAENSITYEPEIRSTFQPARWKCVLCGFSEYDYQVPGHTDTRAGREAKKKGKLIEVKFDGRKLNHALGTRKGHKWHGPFSPKGKKE